MSSAATPDRDPRLPSPGLRRFAWGVLAYFIAVILWGTLVRATGSGAGCGGHWPLCNGAIVQHSPTTKTIIEYTHRIMSGFAFFPVVALLVWTFRSTPRGHLARSAAAAAVALTLVEAILGALLVKPQFYGLLNLSWKILIPVSLVTLILSSAMIKLLPQ